MRSWLIPIGTFLAGTFALGLLVMVAGIVPVKASSGHWPITRWVLNFSKSRSVSTHSAGIEAPSNLEDRAQVMKGAGHFETACAPCHGSPIWRQPRVAQRLTPTPPYLPPRTGEWEQEELFYMVKHGIKFTGMPAFTSLKRDDEIWAVVAFLLELPEIDESEYRELVFGKTASLAGDAPLVVRTHCARCHGLDGQGRETSAFPRLAGLHRDYFTATMHAFADGTRHSGIMEPLAARLSSDEIGAIADFYGNREASATTEAVPGADLVSNGETQADVKRGQSLALNGLPQPGVGACSACHRSDRKEHNASYPVLTGQHADYLVLQLQLFKQRRRGGAHAELMHTVADGLNAEQMRDVAAYYASLK